MKIRKSIILLVILMLASSLIACGGADIEETAASADTAAETDTATETEPDRMSIPDNLPDRDFEGYDFRVVTRGREDFINDIGADLELTGDVVNDAYYNRNLAVMERFNMKISGEYVEQNGTAVHSAVEASAMAGDDAYGMAINQCNTMESIGISGLYLDWYTQLPYVDLTKPWYIGNAAEVLSVHGHAYAMAGEYNMDILRFTSCFYYNQDIAIDYDLEDIYTVVNEGRWTLDYLMELADTVYEDLNGNGTKDFEDKLAVSGDPFDHAISYQYAFDLPITEQDENGFPAIVLDQEKAHDSIVKLNTVYWNSLGGMTKDWGSGTDTWLAGKLLCLTGMFRDAVTFGDLEFNYAIIPYPKYNEDQSSYCSFSAGAAGFQTIPISVSDRERVSIIVEALNAETYKQVVPAYFDITLKNRYSRDEESSKMLELLHNSCVFDFGFVHRSGLQKVFWDMISTNSNDTASKYASLIPAAETLYEEIINGYLKLEESLG